MQSQCEDKLRSFNVFRAGKAFNKTLDKNGWSTMYHDLVSALVDFTDPRLENESVILISHSVSVVLKNFEHLELPEDSLRIIFLEACKLMVFASVFCCHVRHVALFQFLR